MSRGQGLLLLVIMLCLGAPALADKNPSQPAEESKTKPEQVEQQVDQNVLSQSSSVTIADLSNSREDRLPMELRLGTPLEETHKETLSVDLGELASAEAGLKNHSIRLFALGSSEGDVYDWSDTTSPVRRIDNDRELEAIAPSSMPGSFTSGLDILLLFGLVVVGIIVYGRVVQ